MSHLEALSRVSFDLGVFARVARQKLRRTFAYLLLLVVLSTASATASVMLKLRDAVRWLEPHLDEIPTITIKNGRASADVEQPWVKRLGTDDQGHDVVAIIDTTGRRTDFEPNEVGVFLKRTEVAIKTDGDTKVLSLARVPDTTIGPDVIRGWIKEAMRKVPFYLAAFFVVFYLFVKSMQAVLLVLAALVGARAQLRFGELFTVAVYALTPAVLLDCALPFLPFRLPMFLLVYTAMAIAYAILGAQRATAPTPPTDSATL
jgi:uncharacterized protein DUF1189